MAMDLEVGQATLASQPFSALLGARLDAWEGGTARLSLAIRSNHLQQNGFVHGGVLAYLADNAMAFAGGSVLGEFVVTAEFKINLLRPAVGQTLIAQASIVGSTKRQAICRADIFVQRDGMQLLCATALGTISSVSPQGDRRQEA